MILTLFINSTTYSLEPSEQLLFKKIAVLDFEDKGNKYGETAGDAMRDALQKGYPHKIMTKALTTEGLQREGIKIKYPLSSKDIIKIGKALNADAIITGSISMADRVSITGQIFDAKEGQMLAMESFQEMGEAEPLIKRGIQLLAYKLINRIPYKGIVIDRTEKGYTVDAGINQGVAKGAVLSVYEIVGINRHPFLGDVISVDKAEIGTLVVTDVSENSSIAKIRSIKTGREIRVNNKVDYKPTKEIISRPAEAVVKKTVMPSAPLSNEAGSYSIDEILTFNKILPFGFIDKTGKKYDRAVESAVRYVFEAVYPFKTITVSEALIKKELDAKRMAMTHPMPQNVGALIGKVSSADVIVTGSIEMVNNNTRLFIQMVSGKTGEPLFYEEEIIIGQATAAIVRDVARKIANRLINKMPYKSAITNKKDDFVYIDAGKKHGLRNGAILPIFKIRGIKRDPVTNEVVSVDKRMMGEIIVIDAKDYTSTAKMYSVILGEKIDIGSKVMFEPAKDIAVTVLPQMEDVKSEEKAAAAPQSPTKQRIYGDLSTSYNYMKTSYMDSVAPDYIYSTFTTRLNLNMQNLFNSNLSIFFDGNEREDLGSTSLTQQSQYSITTLYLLYQNLFGRLDTFIGRHSVSEGAVYIDGGQLRYNFTPKFRIGGFGGIRSDTNSYEVGRNKTDYEIYGIYGGYDGDILGTSLAYVNMFNKGIFDRGYANLQTYLRPTPYLRFNMYLTEELNFIYSDEQMFDTTNLYVSGTYNPIPDITLSLVYSMFEPFKTFSDKTLSYTEYHEHRYEGRASYRFLRHYNIDASVSYQHREETPQHSIMYSIGAGDTNFLNTEIQWNFRYSLNFYNMQPESDPMMHYHTHSEVYFFSIGRSLFNRLYLDGRYTYQYINEHHEEAGMGDKETAMNILGCTLSMNLPYNFYGLMTYEHTSTKSNIQGSSDADNIYAQVGYRF
ncbi:MAG: hypothetical protein AABY39_08070 [Nitrospirota bacterium]